MTYIRFDAAVYNLSLSNGAAVERSYSYTNMRGLNSPDTELNPSTNFNPRGVNSCQRSSKGLFSVRTVINSLNKVHIFYDGGIISERPGNNSRRKRGIYSYGGLIFS